MPGRLAAAEPGSLRLGIVADRRADQPLDPGQLLLNDLRLDGLTELSSSGTTEPSLAQSWTSSDDGTEWTFDLDPEASFANGDPVTAAAVKRSFESILSDQTQLAGFRLDAVAGYTEFVSGEADDLTGVVASADPETVVFRLSRPSADFDRLLASPALGVQGAAGQGGSSDWSETITSEALPFFERQGTVPDGSVASVTVHTFIGVDEAQQALADGVIDWLPSRISDPMAAAGEHTASPSHFVRFLAMNASSPKLDTVGERLAVALAVDTSAVRDASWGSAAADFEGLVPAGLGWDSGECGSCRFAPDVARQFAEAEIDGATALADTTLRLDHAEDPTSRKAAAEIAEDLGAVGIDVELVAHNSTTYAALLASGDTELYLFGWVGVVESPHAYIASLAGSGSADNLSGLGAAETPAAQALSGLTTAAELDDALAAVEREFIDAAAMVPLGQMNNVASHSARVVSHRIHMDGSLDLASVQLAD